MSKRSRSDTDNHGEQDESISKIAELEAKLADTERQLLYLRTLKLQKLREQPGGIATDSIVQSYTDPLVHVELQAAYSKHNQMILKVQEKDQELAILSSFPNAAALLQENKRLRSDLDNKIKAYDLIQADLKDALNFIEELQSQILRKQEEKRRIEQENEKLLTEIFTWQQQVQQLQQQVQQTHVDGNLGGIPSSVEEVGTGDNNAGDDSPILAVDNDD